MAQQLLDGGFRLRQVMICDQRPVNGEMVRRDSNSSTLREKLSRLARSKAPPIPVRTAKFRGALIPNASVIDTPNVNKRSPLSRAATRVRQPTKRRRPKTISAAVAITPKRENHFRRQIPVEGVGIVQEP